MVTRWSTRPRAASGDHRAHPAQVTAADLANVTKKITSSPPSVAVYGDTTSVPRYDLIAKQFN